MLREIVGKMLGDNIDITKNEMIQVRHLSDFDLKMLLSEINDHGWPMARKLLPMMIEPDDKKDKH